jgi:GNAT superfamily N-acetyltransferase
MTINNPTFDIRCYRPEDRETVIDLFIRINHSLAPPDLRAAFETYVARSVAEEIGRIDEYYHSDLNRSFWVAADASRLLGYFGLEPVTDGAIEVRRMYVDFPFRRKGVGLALLAHAEQQARNHGFTRSVLSTSSLQRPALALYQSAGYVLLRQETAMQASHKTIGSGILRFYLEKNLSDR